MTQLKSDGFKLHKPQCKLSIVVGSRSGVSVSNWGDLNPPKQGDQHVFVRLCHPRLHAHTHTHNHAQGCKHFQGSR